MRDLRILRAAVLLAVVLGFMAAAIPAHAVSLEYPLNLSGCTGGCGTPPFGTVDVVDNGANTVDVTITLFNSERIINTGIGADTVFVFNLSGNPTVTASNITSGFALASGTAGDIHFDGFGDFEYGFTCTAAVCGNGGGDGFGGPVTFTLTGTGLDASDFSELSTGGGTAAYFAVDIVAPSTATTDVPNGNTGAVGANSVSEVPEPGTLVLLGSGLVGLGTFSKRWSRRSLPR